MKLTEAEKIELNVLAGKSARLAFDLIEDAIVEGCNNYSPQDSEYTELVGEFCKAFYSRLAELLGDRLPRKIVDRSLVPMNPAQAKVFEERTIMFGKHAGLKIYQIKERDPEWLDWYARQEDELRKEMNRYLLCERNSVSA